VVFCFAQSENNPPPVQQCHIYLLTCYLTGNQVPDKLLGRVPGSRITW